MRLDNDGGSSQNSRSSYQGTVSINEIFFQGKLPSNFKTYLAAIILMILTVGICLAIQVNITVEGFKQIDFFNRNINVPFLLNSNFNLVLLGRLLLQADSLDLLDNGKFSIT